MQTKLLSALSVFIILAIFSCSGNSSSVEGKIKQYFKDSVTPRLDDPSSLELVSVGKPDTVTDHTLVQMRLDFENENYKSAKSLLEINLSDSTEGSLMHDVYLRDKHSVDSLKIIISGIEKEMTEPDHVIGYESKVAFRAKNKMGALVLNNITIGYYPANDADKRPEHFTVSTEH